MGKAQGDESVTIIKFPRRTPSEVEGQTEEEWREFMLDLHERLFESLERENVEYHLTLSLDDVCELIQAIETAVGSEHFDHDID